MAQTANTHEVLVLMAESADPGMMLEKTQHKWKGNEILMAEGKGIGEERQALARLNKEKKT